MVHITWTLWMFIYACSKFAFLLKIDFRHFLGLRCNGTSKPLITSKPSLTIALKILKTIKKPLTPMVGPSKNIQWWWCTIFKTIEKPLKSMVAWEKTLTIPSLWKIDHRYGLAQLLTSIRAWNVCTQSCLPAFVTSKWVALTLCVRKNLHNLHFFNVKVLTIANTWGWRGCRAPVWRW